MKETLVNRVALHGLESVFNKMLIWVYCVYNHYKHMQHLPVCSYLAYVYSLIRSDFDSFKIQ